MRHPIPCDPLQRHRCINLFVYSYDRSCAFLQVQFVLASPSRTNVHGLFHHSFAIASFGFSFYTKFLGNFHFHFLRLRSRTIPLQELRIVGARLLFHYNPTELSPKELHNHRHRVTEPHPDGEILFPIRVETARYFAI